MKTVYLSLGSNLGDRERQLDEAVTLLAEAGVQVLRRSSLYETAPMYLSSQPWFLNMVVECATGLFPKQLLGRIQRIEKRLGRKRITPNGPRTIDIDILLYGNFRITGADLEVPHPRMGERRFVLEPLAELAPELRHPVSCRTIRELLAGVGSQAVRKVNAG